MAIIISNQPATDSLNAAYRPVYFQVFANQSPQMTGEAPVVYADIYINNVYYKSIFQTQYEFKFSGFGVYRFDIQDVLQEYHFHNKPSVNFDPVQLEYNDILHVFVRFRYTWYDSDGILHQEGPIPQQATKHTQSVAGGGLQSNTFKSFNATIQHENNLDLLSHLQFYNDFYAVGNNLRLTHMPGIKCSCLDSYDWVPMTTTIFSMPTSLVQQIDVTYRNGSTASFSNNVNVPVPQAPWHLFYFATGPKQMQNDFPGVNWGQVRSYIIIYAAPFFEAARQEFKIQCCEEYPVSLFFLNYIGQYDSISFRDSVEYYNTKSERWEKPLSLFHTKDIGGYKRHNVRANEKHKAKINFYNDTNKEWLKEMLDSPSAFVLFKGIEGQADAFVPVNLIDVSDYQLVKEEQEHFYEYEIIFEPGNETIRQR